MNKRYTYYTYLLFSFILALSMGFQGLYCSVDTIAGGSEVGNPTEIASVSGTLFDTDGKRAANVVVWLMPSDYNPIKDTFSMEMYMDTTDGSGLFSIDSIPLATYTLNGEQMCSGKKVFFPEIELKQNRLSDIVDTIAISGTCVISLPNEPADSIDAVYIKGSVTGVLVDSSITKLPGVLQEQLPYLHFYDFQNDRSFPVNDSIHGVFFIPADGIIMYSYKPNKPSGSTAATVGETYEYQANTEPFPPWKDCMGGPDLIRLSWGDGDTSVWQSEKTFSHSWKNTGTYPVRAQVRCSQEFFSEIANFTSSWSESLTVVVSE